ncbi:MULTISPECIES: DUF881 domain-containing protein [Cellulomonas]|uniref:DUF881 domain-containing protein n=1 Tax=Cellulomonas gelida TaxID=1712 RepID=A0A4Y3KPD8_9CELL|nr:MULTISPECIES: DUF881 domain-containing protein [Cellulomonas]MCR6705088.1 DUF881 domain-containing protein [Cellulomonas sp.]GEA85254.1 hypothetical protein CGE01nite_25050 [Cellulomonas gelida]GGL21076.1 hypothetical protein GCM10009774_09220 [Cellulomonas gelida]
MTDRTHRASRRVPRGTASVTVVLALSGALFAANAKFAEADDAERHPQDLRELTVAEVERVEVLTGEVDALRGEVDGLTEAAARSAGTQVLDPPTGFRVESGVLPVTGPGLTVRLDDAPQNQPGLEGISPDVLVVHQQDIQAVMNALWAGGAEAMSLMDQRVISTSAFRCVGNVLRLQGQVYSPPYVVRAIGDPDRLREALADSPQVRAYRADAASVGLGWSVESEGDLEIDAYSGSTDLRYATVPEGTQVLPGLDDEAADAAAAADARADGATDANRPPAR